MDEVPYPGPPEPDSITEIAEMFIQLGRAFGRTMEQASWGITQSANTITETFRGVSTVLATFDEAVSKPRKNHGPRSGPAYDHRGRRRW